MPAYSPPLSEYEFVVRYFLRLNVQNSLYVEMPSYSLSDLQVLPDFLRAAADLCIGVVQPLNQKGDRQGWRWGAGGAAGPGVRAADDVKGNRHIMRSPRQYISLLCAGFAACAAFATPGASAQTFPAKPIRMVVGYTAGGPTDTTARMVAQKMSEHVGQPVIVDNRAGASGTLGKERVATSPPDGYTLLVMSSGDAIVQALFAKTPRDLELGFAPVTLMATGTYVLVVHPSVPVRNVKELVALAKSKPGKLTYGSSGIGSSVHLAGELLKVKANISMVHVPYKSSADSARAAAGGEVELSFPGIPGALPFMQTNKIRALAVTGMKRVGMMANVPTLNESGVPGYDRYGWYGLLAPVGTPKEIIARLNGAVNDVVNVADMKTALNVQGLEPQTNTPEQFAAFIQNEVAENAKLIKLIGLKAE